MRHITWREAAKLGFVERINREILHPVGLAMSYDPDTGISEKLLIADDLDTSESVDEIARCLKEVP